MNVDIPTPLIDEPVRPLILVGNGAYDTAMLAKFAPLGPVVAVDGGYYGCRIAGITPDLLIGDMDSVAAEDLIDARKSASIIAAIHSHHRAKRSEFCQNGGIVCPIADQDKRPCQFIN